VADKEIALKDIDGISIPAIERKEKVESVNPIPNKIPNEAVEAASTGSSDIEATDED